MTAFGSVEPFDFGNQLIILAARPRRGAENLIAAVRQRGGAADMGMFLLPLVHQQLFDQLAAVGQAQFFSLANEAMGQKMVWRSGNTAIAAAQQKILRRADKIVRPDHLVPRLGARSLRFGGIVEQKRDAAIALEQREPLPFDNAVIAGVAQIIGVPIITVEKKRVDAGGLHGKA